MRQQLLKTLVMMALVGVVAIPTFAQSATPEATESGSSSSIAVGDTVNGTLTAVQPAHRYTLNAEAGTSVNIHLTSDAFDAYLVLEDSKGTSLAENDDQDGTNAGIQGFVLPDGGPYTIIAESYGQYEGSGAETGAYTLSVSEQPINHLEYSQTVNGQLTTDTPSQDYVFSGQAGDVIVATESSKDFDSYLHLLDSTGTELTSNDDTGGSLDSTVGPYTLPSTGSYTLRVTSIDGTTAGAFTLMLDKTEVTELSIDKATEVDFTPKDTAKYFTFEGTSGDLVTITADSNGSIDTSLTLNDPNSNNVTSDDNGGPGLDPEIYQQLLTTSGTYTVILQAVTPGTGKLSMTVTHTAPPSLDKGPQDLSFSDSQTARAVMFSAKAGEKVRLNISLTSGDSGSPSVTLTQGDNTVANASGTTVSDLDFSFTPTDDGDVIVQIQDYSYTNLTYHVTLIHSDQ